MKSSKTTAIASLMLLAACGAEPNQAPSPAKPAAAAPASARKLTLTYFNIDG